jgi:hypothetical protein
MSYGIMLGRLKKDDAPTPTRPITPRPVRTGRTPTDIVLAGLYEPVRRPRRRRG